MIILKLIIKPISKERLEKLKINPPKKNLYLTDLTEIYKRDFNGKLSQKILQWIKNTQEHGFGNIVIKNIHTDGLIPTYLDENRIGKKRYLGDPTPVSRKELEDYAKRLSKYIKTLKEKKKEFQERDFRHSIIEEIGELIKKLEGKLSGLRRVLKRNRGHILRIPCRKIRQLGYYTRNGRNSQPNKRKPEVVLLMDSIGMDISLLISTYIHEMFHTYYDLDWLALSQQDLDQANLKYPEHEDLKYIEEPLTEYAMLKFLEDLVGEDQDRIDVLTTVSKSISKKRFNSSTCHYGLGYYLWKWEKEGGKLPHGNWIQNYKNVKSKENLLDYEFIDPFKKGMYPYDNELHYMALLYKLIAEADGQQVSNIATIKAELKNQKIQVF